MCPKNYYALIVTRMLESQIYADMDIIILSKIEWYTSCLFLGPVPHSFAYVLGKYFHLQKKHKQLSYIIKYYSSTSKWQRRRRGRRKRKKIGNALILSVQQHENYIGFEGRSYLYMCCQRLLCTCVCMCRIFYFLSEPQLNCTEENRRSKKYRSHGGIK